MRATLASAFRYSIPVLLGYITLGIAFGLYASEAGYPWYVAQAASLFIYAGAGQFIAVGLFAAGASLLQILLIELMVNARHIAYGVSMLRRFGSAGAYKPYLIFALSDETFALLSSKEDASPRFMFFVALLNQIYWNTGTLIGSVAGAVIPWNLEGIGFALTALFIVLMIEQILRVKKAMPFIISAAVAVAAVFLLPGELSPRLSLLSAMLISMGLVQLFAKKGQE